MRLGEVLREFEDEMPAAVAAFRLLLLTGCRMSEIRDLRWECVKADCIELPDAKTGGRVVPLGPEGPRAVLDAIPREEGNPWVIRGRRRGTHLADLQHPWQRIRKRAGLEDVRIHDLRHSFASRALALGESLTMIGKLLGHTQVQTTARYAHLARDSIQSAASRVTDSIGGDLSGGTPVTCRAKTLMRAGEQRQNRDFIGQFAVVVERFVAIVHRANDDPEIAFLRMGRAGRQEEGQNAQFGHVSETKLSKARRAGGFSSANNDDCKAHLSMTVELQSVALGDEGHVSTPSCANFAAGPPLITGSHVNRMSQTLSWIRPSAGPKSLTAAETLS